MAELLSLAAQEELQRKVRELSFLERIVRVATSSIDHATMLRTIIDETTVATSTQVCSLYLWDAAEQQLVLTATNGLAQSGIGAVKLSLGEGVTGWVAAHRTPLCVPDVQHEPRFTWVPNLDQEHFRSMLSVPIVSRDRVVGVMNVQTVDIHEFGREEIAFVSAIADQLAGIIELSRLHEQVAQQLELERQAVATLTILNRGKSDLMSMLSHDFRGPLTIAKSYLHGLMPELDERQRGACQEIDAELQSLEQMVDTLLVSLEIEAQHTLLLDLEEFSLTGLIADQARRIQHVSPRHEISVHSDGEAIVRADRARIQAVIANLLGNAVKYSPVGGPIRVDISCTAEEVEVGVTDHGIGIDEREVDGLFSRYERGDNALAEGIGGHGLGLFICRHIVEAHSGRISARSAPGGSRFAFSLPMHPEGIQSKSAS